LRSCKFLVLGVLVFLRFLPSVHAQAPSGEVVYQQHCSQCHDDPALTHAPARSALKLMAAENILYALERGTMKPQGSLLSPPQKRSVSEYLAGAPLSAQSSKARMCTVPNPPFAVPGKDWNGWSPDLSNSRFQPAEKASLSPEQVVHLKLKWAFSFPGAPLSWAQPSVVDGRIFIPSANRNVYAIDAKSGCLYWSFEAEAPARTAVVLAKLPGKTEKVVVFFGDQQANAYALDAATGALLWKVHIDPHPRAKIVGALKYYDGRIFVPLTGGEEFGLSNSYPCCSSRGGLIALDAVTGKRIWKTYTISEEPHQTGKTAAGVPTWGPSGASIWSAPTIDTTRKIIYAGTGDNFSQPATATSDAVLAFDMDTGKLLWAKQLTENDVFNLVCVGEGCGEHAGPDFDIGSSPILAALPDGKRLLLVGQKSGVVYALDPDNKGQIVWQTRVGKGGLLGGIQWGSAFDGANVYVAVSDISFINSGVDIRTKAIINPKVGGGLFSLNAKTGEVIWAASPSTCGSRSPCSPAQSAAVTTIPGVVFSGSVDGHLRAYSMNGGKVIWDFDCVREFTTVNGSSARGGSLDGGGSAVADGMLYVGSGYGTFGGVPGNVLLAFSIDGK
jgi:polyvinyl alcohol dehydrogenase (cytochrome)